MGASQGPVADAVSNVFGQVFAHAFGQLAVVILSLLVAAPVIGSMIVLWIGLRWPNLGRSVVANCVGGVSATVVSGFLFGWIVGLASSNVSDLDAFYAALPIFVAGLTALAVFVQVRERASFSLARAAGLACAVLVPVVIVLVQ